MNVVVNFEVKVGHFKHNSQVEIVVPEGEDEETVIEDFFEGWKEQNISTRWERAL
jgi:hypothetical protein